MATRIDDVTDVLFGSRTHIPSCGVIRLRDYVGGHRKSGRYTVRSVLQIERVTSERDRRVVRRLFGEYQRGVTELLNGTDICP